MPMTNATKSTLVLFEKAIKERKEETYKIGILNFNANSGMGFFFLIKWAQKVVILGPRQSCRLLGQRHTTC